MLSKDYVQQLIDNTNKFKKIINDRILEIVEICKKHLKFADDTRYNGFCFIFDELKLNSEESEDSFYNDLYIDRLCKYTFIDEDSCKDEIRAYFIDKYNCYYELKNKIPVRWLWEDFEQELIDGIEKYKNKDSSRYNQVILEKKNYEAIKLKLNEQECELLGINNKIFSLEEYIKRIT